MLQSFNVFYASKSVCVLLKINFNVLLIFLSTTNQKLRQAYYISLFHVSAASRSDYEISERKT
jgi:hypothetical protein